MDFLALVVTGFWPAMAARSATSGIHDLDVLGGFAQTHVDDDLLELRNRHRVGDVELFGQRLLDLCFVLLFRIVLP